MKKFTFTLESLLSVKRTLEKQQMGELAAAEARVKDLRDGLEFIRLRFNLSRVEYNEKLKEGMVPYDITTYAIGFTTLRDKEERQKDKIRDAEHEAELVRNQLVETMKERKMLEMLREKQYTEYLAETRRENERIIGDFVANQIATAGNDGDLNG